MLVPIYSYVSGIDAKILEASDDLGASSWQTFWRVVLPLSLKGIMTGCLVVVLAAFGEFAIPEFIGGGKHAYWGTLVGNNFLLLSDYNAGSAVIFFGIFSLLLSLVIVYYTLQVLLSLISGFVTVPQKILLFKFYD
jgi:spermidine/putrescine transport system permease protein